MALNSTYFIYKGQYYQQKQGAAMGYPVTPIKMAKKMSHKRSKSPVGSIIVDRKSCRVAIMIGGLLMSLGSLLTGFAPNIYVCIFSYGLIAGAGEGILYAVLFVIMGFNFKKRLNLAQGFAASGTGLGLFVLAPVFETSKMTFGYTGFFLILAGISLQTLILGALMRPSTLEMKVKQIRKLQCFEHAHIVNSKIKTNAYRRALLDPFTVLLSFSIFFFTGGLYTLTLHWPNFCLVRGFSYMQSSYILSIIGVVSIIGRISTGIIASLPRITNRIVYCGSMVTFGTAAILFFMFSKSYIGHIILAVIVGLTSGSPYVVITSFTAEGTGVQYLAAAVGFEFLLGGVGSIVVPVFSGYVLKVGLSYNVIFVMSGVCLIICAALVLATKFVITHDHDHIQTKEINIPEKETMIDSSLKITVEIEKLK